VTLKEKIETITEKAKWSDKDTYEMILDFIVSDGSAPRLLELLNHEAKLQHPDWKKVK
jgi:hypothetical protein